MAETIENASDRPVIVRGLARDPLNRNQAIVVLARNAYLFTFRIVVLLSKLRTDLASAKVENSSYLIETNDGHNDGHSTHNNNTTNTWSNSIHICCAYALIMWLNINY